MSKRIASLLVMVLVLVSFSFTRQVQYASAETAISFDDLYIEVGDALMHVKSKEWTEVNTNLQSFKTHWDVFEPKEGAEANEITTILAELEVLVVDAEANEQDLSKGLTSLSKALVAYDKKLNPVSDEKDKLNQLLPILLTVEEQVQADELVTAKEKYNDLLEEWNNLETIVRDESVAMYGAFETQMAFIRIALEQEPADKEQAQQGIEDLRQTITDFVAGKETAQEAEGTYKLSDVIELLAGSDASIQARDINVAIDQLSEILVIWPMVEGEVQTRDAKLYNQVENNIPLIISLLSSKNQDLSKASEMISELKVGLELVAADTSYSFVDAFLVLMREGLEAILIITGLIAFLRKTGHGDKQSWIWGGAVAGVVASAMLAVAIHMFLSALTAASSREYLEGIIGIIAVVMMLTVGAWLHKRSSAKMWNHYVQEHIGKALARGSLISMTALSFLSIFREGAETIIFYAGMAPSIATSQLMLGIALALVLLVIFGYMIIRYSSKIPLRPFFLVATCLIYVLAFKMLGVSIHALQVASVIDSHAIAQVPFVELIGLYPTWETLLPQLAVLVIIFGTSVYVNRLSKNPSLSTKTA